MLQTLQDKALEGANGNLSKKRKIPTKVKRQVSGRQPKVYNKVGQENFMLRALMIMDYLYFPS